MEKTTKSELREADLYLFKKAQVIIAVIVLLIGQVGIVFGAYYSLRNDLDNHMTNSDVHMTYSQKVDKFVPRGEYEDLKKTLDEIKQAVKSNNDNILKLIRDSK